MQSLLWKSAIVYFFLFSFHSFSQTQVLLDSMQLEEAYTYTDLEEALRFPDKVLRLELRKKKYKSVPKEVFLFKNLQWLDLGKNQITELPDTLYLLVNLQFLNVSRNKLVTLPKEIGKMTNLVYINANNNSLIGLPPQIGNLERLRVLDLWSNEFSDFPETLTKLKDLRVMDIRAITISQDNINLLKKWLPNTNVHYDLPCNCKL
jgi:Leucine-rich repeat (LRR) protein